MTFFEIENINKHLADIPTRHSILCPYCLITEIFFMKKKCGEIFDSSSNDINLALTLLPLGIISGPCNICNRV